MADVCSIYVITNNVNNKVYVGQTWQTLEDRFYAHRHVHPHRSKIKNAISKYGEDKFSIKLICIATDQIQADYLENLWIRYYDSVSKGYNIKEGGSRGKFSEESKKLMSESRKGKIPWNKNITGYHLKKERNYLIFTQPQIDSILSDTRSYILIGKDYGCSDNTIRNIYKKHNMIKTTVRLPCSEETKKKIGLANSRKDK